MFVPAVIIDVWLNIRVILQEVLPLEERRELEKVKIISDVQLLLRCFAIPSIKVLWAKLCSI